MENHPGVLVPKIINMAENNTNEMAVSPEHTLNGETVRRKPRNRFKIHKNFATWNVRSLYLGKVGQRHRINGWPSIFSVEEKLDGLIQENAQLSTEHSIAREILE